MHLRGNLLGVDRLRCRAGGQPRLEPDEIDELVEEPHRAPRLAPHEHHVLVVASEDTVEHRLRVAVDDGQRRPQLVPELLGQLDARAHLQLERLDGLGEPGGRPLPPHLLGEQARQDVQQRLLVGRRTSRGA